MICSACTNEHIRLYQCVFEFDHNCLFDSRRFPFGKLVFDAFGVFRHRLDYLHIREKWMYRLDIFQHKLVVFYIQITVLAHRYNFRDRKTVNAAY